MADVEELVEEAMEAVSEIGDDVGRLTQEESEDFYLDVASQCSARAQALREEINAIEANG